MLAWRKRKLETILLYTFPFLQESNEASLFPPSKQRVHKSQFLQKLSCQKPYWDQARLSSLVNKLVVEYLEYLEYLEYKCIEYLDSLDANILILTIAQTHGTEKFIDKHPKDVSLLV